jgi:heme-degrading monooxygenase HmoA
VIARMWETKVNPGQLDELCAWLKTAAWPQFVNARGFSGGEVYRSDDQDRAVVLTRWVDADTMAEGIGWFDLGAERFSDGEASAWQFDQVEVR